jgi:crotonobetainyl-CoA:carnitine CoA-transferase CaiB-like acyl-CoA transferase
VILVERVGGNNTRNIPPFIKDIPHKEGSLFFAYHNANKRSITLDLECSQGQEIFRRLINTAHIIIETFPPEYMENLGIGYSMLREINPYIILTSITHFGLTGPNKGNKGADIVDWAMGGMMNQTGNPDEPPVMGPGWQTYYIASSYAAVGTLIALYHRRKTEQGQLVDVSIQECVASLLEGTNPLYVYEGKVTRRMGSQHPLAYPSRIFTCKDGYWVTNLNNAPLWKSLVSWIVSGGVGVDELTKPEYEDLDIRRRAENDRIITPLINEWGMLHTKTEIFEEGQKRHLPVGPTMTIDEVVNDPHLNDRGFFVEVKHPYTGSLKFPGAPYKFSETPWMISHAAPLIGEHNIEVYDELGFSKEELVLLRANGVI